MSETPKRGWLSFSIRDLMLATVIVALAVVWWIDHRAAKRLATENARLKQNEGLLELKREMLRSALAEATDARTAAAADRPRPAKPFGQNAPSGFTLSAPQNNSSAPIPLTK